MDEAADSSELARACRSAAHSLINSDFQLAVENEHAQLAAEVHGTLMRASRELDARTIHVHKKQDGLLMVNNHSKARFMTWRERLAFWLLGNSTEIRL